MAILKRQLIGALNSLGDPKAEKAILAGFGAPSIHHLAKKDYAKMADVLRARGVNIAPANYTDEAKGFERLAMDRYYPPAKDNPLAEAAAKESTIGDKLHAVAEGVFGRKLEKPDAEA